MSLLFEQNKLFGKNGGDSGSISTKAEIRSISNKDLSDRIRTIEKTAFDAAQVSMISAADVQIREKRVDALFLGVGVLGAAGELTLKMTDWVPIAQFRTVWSVSLLLLILPLAKSALALCRKTPLHDIS